MFVGCALEVLRCKAGKMKSPVVVICLQLCKGSSVLKGSVRGRPSM